MLGNLSLLTHFNIKFFKKLFQEHHQRDKWFGSRSGPTSVGPGLGPNRLQRLSVDNKSHCQQNEKSQ